MVEVGVEKQDRRRSCISLVGELHPGGDPRQGGIPALAADRLRLWRQPEVAAGDLLEASGLVEQRRHLPLLPPVVAADAGGFVAVKKPEELIPLESKGFLRAEEIGVETGDRVGEELLPLRPGVHTVIGGAVADVEAHHTDRLAGCHRHRHAEHRQPRHETTDGERSHRSSCNQFDRPGSIARLTRGPRRAPAL